MKIKLNKSGISALLERVKDSRKRKLQVSDGALKFNCADQKAVSWNDRAKKSAKLIAKAALLLHKRSVQISDVGCGDGKLEEFISADVPNFTYRGYDLHPQAKNFKRINIQFEKLDRQCDIAALLGILEYVPDIHKALQNLATGCRYLVVSHACHRIGITSEQMAALNWVSILAKDDFEAELRRAGFLVIEDVVTENGQTVIWLCKSTTFTEEKKPRISSIIARLFK